MPRTCVLSNASPTPHSFQLERMARCCRAITYSPVIGTKAGNDFCEILGYGLIYRNFSVLLLS